MKPTPNDIVIEDETFISWKGNDGIMRTHVKPGAMIELKHAEINTLNVEKLSNNTILPLIVDNRKITSISKEARDHFSMRGRTPKVSAIAILVGSPLSRIIGNFFMGLNKPTVPTRLFQTEAAATNWIKELGLL